MSEQRCCENCKFNDLTWRDEPCGSCKGFSGYKSIQESSEVTSDDD